MKKDSEKELEQPNKEPSKLVAYWRKNRPFFLVIGVLLLVILVQVWILKNRTSNLETNMKKQQNELIDYSKLLLESTGSEYLGLMTKTFAWAIRAEMIKENYDQINLYIIQLIREKNVREVIVTDENGLIVASSNKKFEQQDFSTFYSPDLIASKEVTTSFTEDNTIILTSPIMSFNDQLGNIMISYSENAIKNLQVSSIGATQE
ncbi:MAG: hypothetical protein RJQ09_20190 [Cyclobacteriaceae bacterium]